MGFLKFGSLFILSVSDSFLSPQLASYISYFSLSLLALS